MHFLFTDPSTSPRTELGRVMFGALLRSWRDRSVQGPARSRSTSRVRQAAASAGVELVRSSYRSRGEVQPRAVVRSVKDCAHSSWTAASSGLHWHLDDNLRRDERRTRGRRRSSRGSGCRSGCRPVTKTTAMPAPTTWPVSRPFHAGWDPVGGRATSSGSCRPTADVTTFVPRRRSAADVGSALPRPARTSAPSHHVR